MNVNDSLLLRKPGDCLIYWVKVLHIMKVYKIPLPRRNNQAKPNPSQNASKSGWYLIMLMPCKVPSILNKSTQLASHRNMWWGLVEWNCQSPGAWRVKQAWMGVGFGSNQVLPILGKMCGGFDFDLIPHSDQIWNNSLMHKHVTMKRVAHPHPEATSS